MLYIDLHEWDYRQTERMHAQSWQSLLGSKQNDGPLIGFRSHLFADISSGRLIFATVPYCWTSSWYYSANCSRLFGIFRETLCYARIISQDSKKCETNNFLRSTESLGEVWRKITRARLWLSRQMGIEKWLIKDSTRATPDSSSMEFHTCKHLAVQN